MSRRVFAIVGTLIVIAIVAGGIVFWFAPDDPELSGDVNESVARLTTEEATAEVAETTPEAEVEEEATPEATDEAEATPEAEVEEEATPEATDEAEAETETTAEAASSTSEVTSGIGGDADTEVSSGEGTVFRIDSEQSTAEFNIDEVLRGDDVTVVGTTNQVAGDILVNLENPAESEIGEILINARSLETDASGRNRALRNFILLSGQDEYEFISFQPTAIENMPESVSVGDTIEFQVVGDLTILDTTQEVTFDVTATLDSETEIEGSGETTVLYQDFDITIPEVPFVASVEDEVTLIIEFVATGV